MLSIVVPTIEGREDELSRTIRTYEQLTPGPIEWIIERGHSNCGAGWNAGARRATGDILHMGADDIEPESAAWFPAALRALGRGHIPLGWVREEAHTFGRDFARVVICRRDWWQDVPELHYYSDNAFTDLMAAAGHPATVAEGFDFYHRRSLVGRDESSTRLERERRAYECSIRPS